MEKMTKNSWENFEKIGVSGEVKQSHIKTLLKDFYHKTMGIEESIKPGRKSKNR